MSGGIENVDQWQMPPRVDVVLVDSAYAERLKAECSNSDREGAGSHADRILGELLRKMGLAQTAEAYEALNLWRA
ncbi:MAG: hypothetical protein ABW169_05725 [Sphingobium sp.]